MDHTIDIGPVHVHNDDGTCRNDCPHPNHDDPGDDLYVCAAGHHHCDGPCTLDHDCRAEHPHHRPGCYYDVPAADRAAWYGDTYADRL